MVPEWRGWITAGANAWTYSSQRLPTCHVEAIVSGSTTKPRTATTNGIQRLASNTSLGRAKSRNTAVPASPTYAQPTSAKGQNRVDQSEITRFQSRNQTG